MTSRQTRLQQKQIAKLHADLIAGRVSRSGAQFVARDDMAPQLHIRLSKSEVVMVWYGWAAGRARTVTLAKYPQCATEEGWLKRIRDQARQISNNPDRHFLGEIAALAPEPEPEIQRALTKKATLEDALSKYFESAEFQRKKAKVEIEKAIRRRFLIYPELDATKTATKQLRADRFGLKPLNYFTRQVLSDWFETVHRHASVYIANRTLAYIKAAISWLEKRGHIEEGLFARIPCVKEPKSPRKALPLEYVRALWKCASTMPNHRQGDIIKLLILTGQRYRVIAGMKHNELTIDGNKHVWLNVPAERSKGDHEYKLPLLKCHLKILTKYTETGSDLLFPTATQIVRLDGESKRRCNDAIRKAIGKEPEPWCFHNLRKNCRNMLDDLGVNPYVAELLIGHKIKFTTGTEGSYLTKSFDKEVRAAMELYCARMIAVCEGDELEFQKEQESVERTATLEELARMEFA